MVSGKEPGTYEFKSKTEVGRECPTNKYGYKVTMSNKDFAFEAKVEPKGLNKDGMHSIVKGDVKYIPAAENWEGKLEFKVGGYEIGPITPWSELQLDTNKAKNHMVTYSQNLLMEKNFNLAWKLVGDVNKNKLT